VYLRIAVQDGSTTMPPLIDERSGGPADRLRGVACTSSVHPLQLAPGTASASPGGKIVWALLRAHPIG
jgi:hypothetical protein